MLGMHRPVEVFIVKFHRGFLTFPIVELLAYTTEASDVEYHTVYRCPFRSIVVTVNCVKLK